jgi:glycosyltransferase involved in cell wall biosynthesis
MDRKRILYIHHGNARGGAFLSLLYLIRSLDQNLYEPIVCNGGDEQDPEVQRIFNEEGYETCACRLPRFAHTTGGSYSLLNLWSLRQLYEWIFYYSKVKNTFNKILKNIRPDIVHFNSLTLAPYAIVPYKMNIPTVVHVRESILHGFIGFRKRWLRNNLVKYACKIIVICQDNLDRIDLPIDKGIVIYNPVDFAKFNYQIDQTEARKQLGISDTAHVVLFAGGSVWEAKGLPEFLASMQLVKKKYQNIVCLMPSFQCPFDPIQRVWTFKRRIAKILQMFRKSDKLFYLYKSNNLYKNIISKDFVYEIENWIAACDVVCVPHMRPHFSRTIMEAGAMKKPVAVFRIGGIEEVVKQKETGLMVERGNVESLASSIIEIIGDKALILRLGLGGYTQAIELFDARTNAYRVMAIYDELIINNNKNITCKAI